MISSTKTVPTSVITSQLWITLDEENKKQYATDLSPVQWIDKEFSTEQRKCVTEILTKPTEQFRSSRNKHLKFVIDLVTIVDVRTMLNIEFADIVEVN